MSNKKNEAKAIVKADGSESKDVIDWTQKCQAFGKLDMDDKQCRGKGKKSCNKANKEMYAACEKATADAAEAVATKKAATGTKAKKSSESKLFIAACLAAGRHTRKEIMNLYLTQYPDHAASTVGTYLSDSQNEKYDPFKRIVIKDKATGILRFHDVELNVKKAA